MSLLKAKSYREQLIDARPTASNYAESLKEIPDTISERARGLVSELVIYPIKALAGVKLREAKITSTGLSTVDGNFHDRSAMLVRNASGKIAEGAFDAVRFSSETKEDLSYPKHL